MAEKETRIKSTMGGKSKPKKRKSKKPSKHVKEMTLRHAANGGYIATHKNDPEEGQEEEQDPQEHALGSHEEMLDHVDQHMAVPQPQPAPAQQVAGV